MVYDCAGAKHKVFTVETPNVSGKVIGDAIQTAIRTNRVLPTLISDLQTKKILLQEVTWNRLFPVKTTDKATLGYREGFEYLLDIKKQNIARLFNPCLVAKSAKLKKLFEERQLKKCHEIWPSGIFGLPTWNCYKRYVNRHSWFDPLAANRHDCAM